MRCYFTLVSDDDVIVDNVGVEVPDLEAARAQAAMAIHEILEEEADTPGAFEGWHLEVVDGSSRLLFSLPITYHSPCVCAS